MTKKLGISEALVKDAVLRKKSNSVSATYHLLSRRHSKGYGFRELNSKFVLDCRASRDKDTLEREDNFDEEETASLSYIQSADDLLKEPEESSDISEENKVSVLNREQIASENDEHSRIGSNASVNRPQMAHRKLGYSDVRKSKPKSGRNRTYSTEFQPAEEIVTIDRKGVITQTKRHSTTVITLPRCSLENESSHVASKERYRTTDTAVRKPENLTEASPKLSYKDYLRKLRSKRTISPSKGILKTVVGENLSRPESVIHEGEDIPDDMLSSADTLQTNSCEAYKRQSCASAKSVRFHLNEEERTRLKSKSTTTQKVKPNSSTTEGLLPRKPSAENSRRQDISSRNSQKYTWGSFSSQGSRESVASTEKILKPSSYLLNTEHQPTAVPPNSAEGHRWRRPQDHKSGTHSMVRREPSSLSNTSSKTRKQVLDRYKLKIRSGNSSHGDQSLVVNVTVVNCNPVSRTNKYVNGVNPRILGNIRGSTITLVKQNSLYKGTDLPPTTQTNTERPLSTLGSIFYVTLHLFSSC